MLALENLFLPIFETSNPKRLKTTTHDLFVQWDREEQRLSLLNEDDVCLATLLLEDSKFKGEEALHTLIKSLQETVTILEARGFWTNSLFELPFSIELIDKEFNTLEVLYFYDEDIVPITEPLLSGHRSELEDFLKQLLAE